MKTLMALCGAVLLLISCSSGIDKAKFADLRKDADAIVKDLDQKADYLTYEEHILSLSSHLLTAEQMMSTPQEKSLAARYRAFLTVCQDALLFWNYRAESSLYPWVPKGRVYVGDDLKPVVLKYAIPMQQHYLQLTDRRWESAPAESLDLIFRKVREGYSSL